MHLNILSEKGQHVDRVGNIYQRWLHMEVIIWLHGKRQSFVSVRVQYLSNQSMISDWSGWFSFDVWRKCNTNKYAQKHEPVLRDVHRTLS